MGELTGLRLGDLVQILSISLSSSVIFPGFSFSVSDTGLNYLQVLCSAYL